MAPSRRSGSLLAKAALGLLCWSVALRALDLAFAGAGSPASSSRMVSSLVPRRYNIFEGLQGLQPAGGDVQQDPDEVGTRSQREADGIGRLVECNLPLGLEFEEKDGGDIYIKSVEQDTDAWDQGVRPGAQLTMVSATFGDEMWNARKVGMTQFMQTLNSRFGNTISLQLEKENQNILQSFFEAAMPKPKTEDEKKRVANMNDAFEEEEARLQNKGMWNPFR